MKEQFIKSTLILVIGGFITKILGMIIRIITTRVIGLEGLGLYMMIIPTFNLFITIATLSLPVAISKLVSEGKKNNKKLVLGFVPIAILFNILLIILIIIFAPYIANNLLQNKLLYLPILSISITLPFITISSIIKGYFFGKQKMLPNVISNTIEQIIRIVAIIIIIPILANKNIIYAVTGLVLINCLSEIFSIITLIFFLPKKIVIHKNDIKPNAENIKDICAISIPTTLGRLVSAIGSFLEPIIITYVLLKLGTGNIYITNEYGIISGYVLPMIMMPSFLTGAISSALLPVISASYAKKNYIRVKSKIKQATIFSLVIGIPCTLIMFFFPEFCLKTIFNTNLGSIYLKYSSILFLISYILGPLSSALQAMNKSNIIMISSSIGVIIKIILLFSLSYLNIGMWPLIIASFIQFIFILIYQITVLKKII